MAVLFKARGPVAVVTINRPNVMNAIDPETNDELIGLWKRFEQDDSLRVAVLTGAGEKAFSAGADLRTLIPSHREQITRGERANWNFGGLTRGVDIGKPIIAAINGHCLAGGLEMALACDIRICSPNATFGLAEVRWGIIPGAAGTQRLPRAIPLSVAMEMILSGDPIDATEALRIGLVSRIVERAELLDAALRLADTIASRAPRAVRAAKRAVLVGLDRGFEEGMRLEEELFRELMVTDDAATSAASFGKDRRL